MDRIAEIEARVEAYKAALRGNSAVALIKTREAIERNAAPDLEALLAEIKRLQEESNQLKQGLILNPHEGTTVCGYKLKDLIIWAHTAMKHSADISGYSAGFSDGCNEAAKQLDRRVNELMPKPPEGGK